MGCVTSYQREGPGLLQGRRIDLSRLALLLELLLLVRRLHLPPLLQALLAHLGGRVVPPAALSPAAAQSLRLRPAAPRVPW